jgi:hypothetical protein
MCQVIEQRYKRYDDVVASFVHLFNSREFDKVRLYGEYECAIMFNGFALENLCFLKTMHSDGRHSARRCSYQFEEMNRNVTLKRTSTKRGERVKAGMNIFLNVKRLILPYNIPGYHWMFFSVNPNTLQQQFFDVYTALWMITGI